MNKLDDNPTENIEQKALMHWWNSPKVFPHIDKKLLWATPNSAGFGKMRMVAGARVGIPDLFLAYPSGDYCGLFIELKRKKGGRVSEEQAEYIERLERVGYACAVCRGFESARDVITHYLGEYVDDFQTRAPDDHERC